MNFPSRFSSASFASAIAVIGILFISTCSMSIAQDDTDDLIRSVIDLRQRVEKDETLSEAVKAELTPQVQAAEANLSKIEELKKRIAADRQATESAAERAAGYVADLEKLKAAAPDSVPKTAPGDVQANPVTAESVAKADRDVDELKKAIDGYKRELDQIERENTRRASRRLTIRADLDAQEKKNVELKENLSAIPKDDTSLGTQAKRIVLQTAQAAASFERTSFIAEQERYDKSDQEKVVKNQRDLLGFQLAQGQLRLTTLEKIQADQRKEFARLAAETAAKDLKKVKAEHPLLVSSYKKNEQLAIDVQAYEARALRGTQALESVKSKLTLLEQQAKDARRRVHTIGLTGSVGAMLRKRKAELPDTRLGFSNADKIKTEMNQIQYEIFDVEQGLDELSPELIRQEIETASGPLAELTFESLKEPIEELIVARREKLEALGATLDRLFEDVLAETEYNERKLADQTAEFEEYINERILWIRSNDLLFSKIEIEESDRAVLSSRNWVLTLQNVWDAIRKSPVEYGFYTVIILLLLYMKPRFRSEVDKMGQLASRGSCDSFWPTGRALVLTVLIALAIPLILLVLGFGLSRSPLGDGLTNALGRALMAAASFALPLEVLRRICRTRGLANQHFDWGDNAVSKLRSNLSLIVIPETTLVFCISFLRNLDSTHRVDLVQRILFIVGMLVMVWFAYRTFHPKLGIFEDFLNAQERSWANQTSTLWFGAILALPLFLAGLAIWGYYYTAIRLAECVFWTFVLAVVAETVRELLKRLILVQRRHVHIQAARRKYDAQLLARKEHQKAQAAAQAALESGEAFTPVEKIASSPPIDSLDSLMDLEHEVDIDENAKQANKLVSLGMVVVWAIGLWLIWTDVLPALKALDNYTLWPTNMDENGLVAIGSESGSASAETATLPGVPGAMAPSGTTESAAQSSAATPRISVRNLLVFIVITIVTLISTRNLPSALEMLLLDHLPVDRSLRYALKSLFSYAIIMIGLILAFRAVSITWSSVQWLATALTFGLAFGLQEIFANFVAGIILMFERPIRIGDWVTVDEFTGVVTKIRTRATTIVNWDRKEFVIPNKDFITGRLVNWTLSDAINRIVINIGVAYGSDVEKAKAILLDVCTKHPKTVDDPSTSVIFDGFGESSLNLLARTFIGDIDSRPSVIDQLNTQINARFNEAGIEISFPQRDLHIRSVSPGVGELFDGQSAKRPRNGSQDVVNEDIILKKK